MRVVWFPLLEMSGRIRATKSQGNWNWLPIKLPHSPVRYVFGNLIGWRTRVRIILSHRHAATCATRTADFGSEFRATRGQKVATDGATSCDLPQILRGRLKEPRHFAIVNYCDSVKTLLRFVNSWRRVGGAPGSADCKQL